MVVAHRKMAKDVSKVRITGRPEELNCLKLPKQWRTCIKKDCYEVTIPDWYVPRAVGQAVRAITEVEMQYTQELVIEKLSLPKLEATILPSNYKGLYYTDGTIEGVYMGDFSPTCNGSCCAAAKDLIKKRIKGATKEAIEDLMYLWFAGHPRYNAILEYANQFAKKPKKTVKKKPTMSLEELTKQPIYEIKDEADPISDEEWEKLYPSKVEVSTEQILVWNDNNYCDEGE